jgi:hypothetical protein
MEFSDQVRINDQVIKVIIRDDSQEREKGLMNVPFLADGQGMFFIHERESVLSYWMKNMLIPIDIIFIDKNFQIIKIYHHVPVCTEDPCPSYWSDSKVKYGLEVPAGYCERIGIKVGDKVGYKGKG